MKSRAIVAVENGKIEVRPVEPRAVGAWDLKIELESSAVSPGTETYIVTELVDDTPLIPGYGPIGRIVEAGSQTCSLFRVGDRVSYCCADPPVTGEKLLHGGHQSPAVMSLDPDKRDLKSPDGYCVKVPDGLSSELAAFGGIASVSSMAATMPQPKPGDTVLVIGQGVIGQFCAQHFSLRGAEVAVADLHAGRLGISKACGADHVINASEVDLVNAVKDIWPDGADIVADASASTEVVEDTIEAVKPRGKYVFVGSYQSDLNIHCLQGTRVFEAFFPWTLTPEHVLHSWRMMIRGGLKVEPLITHRMNVDDAAAAFDVILNSPSEYTGVVFDWTR